LEYKGILKGSQIDFTDFKKFVERKILPKIKNLRIKERGAIRNRIRYAENDIILDLDLSQIKKQYNLEFDTWNLVTEFTANIPPPRQETEQDKQETEEDDINLDEIPF
jgi:hypothetical protein